MKPTILVVDDDKLVLEAIAELLEDSGFRVIQAHNGMKAEECLRSSDAAVDVCLIDYAMPMLNGVEAFQRLREVKPDLVGILVTGFSEGEFSNVKDQEDLKSFAKVVSKPFNLELLLGDIRSLLSSGENKTRS